MMLMIHPENWDRQTQGALWEHRRGNADGICQLVASLIGCSGVLESMVNIEVSQL